MGTSEELMDEEQANEIIAKLDYLYLNAMTKAQAEEIIQRIKEIAAELAEMRACAEKE